MDALHTWVQDRAGITAVDLERVCCWGQSLGRMASPRLRKVPAAERRAPAAPAHRRAMLGQDFASGYQFGALFAALGLQPDFPEFVNRETPDAHLINHTRLQVLHAADAARCGQRACIPLPHTCFFCALLPHSRG
jgi:hypothetical protein